jgi:hypothetical protein
MKSKELIRLIQEADPTGEEHVCIQNVDIWHVSEEPAYYDGALHVVDRDEDERPTRGRRIRTGKKINITPLSVSDGFDYSGYEVEYLTEADRERYEHLDIEHRRQDKAIKIDVDRTHFANWVFRVIQGIRRVPLTWVERITTAANDFYDRQKIGPDNPITKVTRGSYNDCREAHWAETILVNWDNYSRIIIDYKLNIQTSEEDVDSGGGEHHCERTV